MVDVATRVGDQNLPVGLRLGRIGWGDVTP